MTNNIDIFICTHTNYNIPVKNDVYKLISCGAKDIEGAIMDNTGDNISRLNGFYCELSGIYWVWKNWELKDYVGFCHYRRYFEFMDDVPNMDNEDCDVIILEPIKLDYSMRDAYSNWHNVDDLDLIIDIAKYEYGVYHNETLSTNLFNARNMFIMSKDLFNEYCEFLFGVLTEYCKRKNIKSMVDVYCQVLSNPKYGHRYKYKHQARIGGFLAERLMQTWVSWKQLKIKMVKCIEI